MFCPNCGAEYREGFSRCVDCELDLVAAPPPPAAHPDVGDFVTVFATGDPVLLMTAKSLLDDAAIPYIARGEGMQDLFGMGRLGTGFNLVIGPMELLVPVASHPEAQDLLSQVEMEPAPPDAPQEEET